MKEKKMKKRMLFAFVVMSLIVSSCVAGQAYVATYEGFLQVGEDFVRIAENTLDERDERLALLNNSPVEPMQPSVLEGNYIIIIPAENNLWEIAIQDVSESGEVWKCHITTDLNPLEESFLVTDDCRIHYDEPKLREEARVRKLAFSDHALYPDDTDVYVPWLNGDLGKYIDPRILDD